MSLADELLADLDDIEDEVEGEEAGREEVMEAVAEMDTKGDRSVRSFAKLLDGEKFKWTMEQIDHFMDTPRQAEVKGPVEADPEYKLIVDANNLVVEVDNESNIVHKYVRDLYSKRFPELESLVHTPLEYCRSVKLLGNSLEVAKVNLQEILPAATVMVVSVTASTTQGQKVEQEEVDLVFEACDMMETLNEAKLHMLKYVESRMSLIAPNLSAMVGSTVATKLMGVAGGLTNLSKMPACNILVLGAQRKTLSGFSTATVLPHTGFIYYSDAVQSIPEDLRKKAARLLACKCTLAARVDGFHESPDGAVGRGLMEEVQKKLDKWTEPPPVKQAKPLPRPEEAPRKKRGGRRVRRMKERYEISEMRKQANRMTFGEIEEDAYQDDLGFSMGQMGKSGTGRVRGPAMDQKTQVTISKRLQKRLQTAQVFGAKSTVRGQESGTA